VQPHSSFLGASPNSRFLTARAIGAIRLALLLSIVLMTGLLCSGTNPAATNTPTLLITPAYAPPGTNISLWGSGFDPFSSVEIYCDAIHLATTTTNAAGAFGGTTFHGFAVQLPASAIPGNHWILAMERSGQKLARKQFLVRTDWAQYGFGPERTGFNPYENVLNSSTLHRLYLHWRQGVSSPYNDATPPSPAVANGVVYLGGYHLADFFLAFGAGTGTQLWYYRTGGEIHSSAAVANGAVYFGSDDKNLYALHVNNGGILWQFTNQSPVAVSPAIVKGVIYFSADNYVYALSAATGAVLWQYNIPAQFIAVANGILYATGSNAVFALRADTGALVWQQPIVGSDVAVANGMVYVGTGSGLDAMDANTGAMMWSCPMAYGAGSPAVANGVVYVKSGTGPMLSLYAVNASTGAILWQRSTDFYNASAPTVANGVVYFGLVSPTSSAVQAFDANSGGLLWSYYGQLSVHFSPPVIADGTLYVAASDGNLYAFGL